MSDDLRTRIAAVLQATDEAATPGTDPYGELADAVIRELGLRKVTDANRAVPQSRYVTEWEPDV